MTKRIEYGQHHVIEVVALDRLDLLEKNARFMRAEMLRRLVENIQQDGQISQLPFCVPLGDDHETCRFLVLSGNHRVKGARAAGLAEIPVIYVTKSLTKEEQLAIQLSHNAIAGEDDPVILKELWSELEGDITSKLYSGLDDKMLRELEKVSIPAISEVRLDFRTLTFLFLPEEQDQFEAGVAEARRAAERSDVYLARFGEFDRMLDALETVERAYNVKNAATGLMVLFTLMQRHLHELSEGWHDELTDTAKHKGWVPLSTIFGKDAVPAEVAVVIKQAVDRLRKSGDVTDETRWRALEFMAASIMSM